MISGAEVDVVHEKRRGHRILIKTREYDEVIGYKKKSGSFNVRF